VTEKTCITHDFRHEDDCPRMKAEFEKCLKEKPDEDLGPETPALNEGLLDVEKQAEIELKEAENEVGKEESSSSSSYSSSNQSSSSSSYSSSIESSSSSSFSSSNDSHSSSSDSEGFGDD